MNSRPEPVKEESIHSTWGGAKSIGQWSAAERYEHGTSPTPSSSRISGEILRGRNGRRAFVPQRTKVIIEKRSESRGENGSMRATPPRLGRRQPLDPEKGGGRGTFSLPPKFPRRKQFSLPAEMSTGGKARNICAYRPIYTLMSLTNLSHHVFRDLVSGRICPYAKWTFALPKNYSAQFFLRGNAYILYARGFINNSSCKYVLEFRRLRN